MAHAESIATSRPLCVDLDGTLVVTDLLWESLLVLLKTRPSSLFLLPFWLCKGRAFVKREIARRVALDVSNLPYRLEVLRFLRTESESGREIILTTASDGTIAHLVADHLGLFSSVLASDGKTNLSGEKKLEAIKRHTGENGFDYIGDSIVDLPLWRSAHQAMIVSPSSRLLKRASESFPVGMVFPRESKRLLEIPKALRVHQWIKNVLVFVPLITAHRILDADAVFKAILAFAACSLCASSVYVINDLVDLNSDRQHPYKKNRPFARGTLPINWGVVMAPLLLVFGLAIAMLGLPRPFLLELLTYFGITLVYSFWIKQVAILDVLTLAGLYTIRVLAGGAAAGIEISPWLLAFSTFLFLSMAFLKRYAELRMVLTRPGFDVKGRDYSVTDMGLLRSVGSGSGLLCILVLALYLNSPDVVPLYRSPLVLWLIGPCLLYWIIRLWLLADRRQIEEDPILFTVRDPVSYVIGAAVVVIILAASFL